MSLAHGTKIIRDGLVFAYDIANVKKSWIGRPSTNLIPNPTNEINGSEFTRYANLAPIFDANGLVPYSLSLDIKANKEGNVLFYMQNGSSSKYGFVSTRRDITTEYQRFTFNNITPNISNTEDTEAWFSIYTTYGSGVRPTVKNIQLELGTTATPFIEGTRSNTEALLDFTGNHTITANSLTYNSDGSFGFNGSSNRLSFPQPNIPVSVNDWTIEMWVYPTSSGHLLVPNSNGIDQQIRWSTDKFVVVTCSSADTNGRAFDTGTASAPINTWSLLTVSISYRTVNLYVNGILKSSTVNDVDIAPWSGTWNVGQRGNNTNYFGGKIGLMTVYDRPLTDLEIKQNYEAAKGRFQ